MNEHKDAVGPESEQQESAPRRAAVSTGNPRINVAFPFAKIAVQEPSEALCDLAALVEQIAEQLVTLTRQAGPEQADAADRLAAQAAVLARRLSPA